MVYNIFKSSLPPLVIKYKHLYFFWIYTTLLNFNSLVIIGVSHSLLCIAWYCIGSNFIFGLTEELLYVCISLNQVIISLSR